MIHLSSGLQDGGKKSLLPEGTGFLSRYYYSWEILIWGKEILCAAISYLVDPREESMLFRETRTHKTQLLVLISRVLKEIVLKTYEEIFQLI